MIPLDRKLGRLRGRQEAQRNAQNPATGKTPWSGTQKNACVTGKPAEEEPPYTAVEER